VTQLLDGKGIDAPERITQESRTEQHLSRDHEHSIEGDMLPGDYSCHISRGGAGGDWGEDKATLPGSTAPSTPDHIVGLPSSTPTRDLSGHSPSAPRKHRSHRSMRSHRSTRTSHNCNSSIPSSNHYHHHCHHHHPGHGDQSPPKRQHGRSETLSVCTLLDQLSKSS
jgi:hypothetical protein